MDTLLMLYLALKGWLGSLSYTTQLFLLLALVFGFNFIRARFAIAIARDVIRAVTPKDK